VSERSLGLLYDARMFRALDPDAPTSTRPATITPDDRTHRSRRDAAGRPARAPTLPLAGFALLLGCGAAGAVPASPPMRAQSATFVEAEVLTEAPDPLHDAWTAEVAAVVAAAEGDSQTFRHVQSLTDAAGPRLAGSVGDRLAVQWGVTTMTDLGLSNVRAEPVAVRVWERGEERVEVVAPTPHRLAAAALGGSVPTPEGGVEAEVVRVASLEALAALPRAEVEGKVVFIDRPMERRRDGSGYGEAVVVRSRGASEAARLGARAVLIRSIGTDSTRFPHTGALRYAEDAPRIPAASISNPDADVLGRWLTGGTVVRVRVSLGCRDAGEATSANVIGEVPGTDRAEEIVIVGAHLDAWDLGRGAIDDGAGVAIVLEVARHLARARLRPRRTLRVVLFANEENGLAGARAYAAAHAAELPRHVLGLEADFGDGRAWALRSPDSPARTAPWARIHALLAPLGVAWDPEPPHGGADLGPMHEAGVPVADVLQDGTRYFDLHHTPNDVLSQVDAASLEHAMRAALGVAYAATLDVEGLSRAAPNGP
jgi:Zn-dependent M28 family amino/carboxypeptidase